MTKNTNFASTGPIGLKIGHRCGFPPHIVPCGKFHRIEGAPPDTFPSEKYDAPEEMGGDRKSFDSPIRK